MYWAMDKEGNMYFPNVKRYELFTDSELENAFYWELEEEEPRTFETVKQLFEDIKIEANNGGFDEEETAEILSCKNVFEYIRKTCCFYNTFCPLLPVSETDMVLEKIALVCKRNGWTEKLDYTRTEMQKELISACGKLFAPNWLITDDECLIAILDFFWDPDCGYSQCLYD